MRVFNEQIVIRFARKHPDCRQWLEGWLAGARAAQWQSIADVRLAYPAADGGVKVKSGVVVTVFDVGGNKYRLIAHVQYARQITTVLEVLTHADYSKNLWKRRH